MTSLQIHIAHLFSIDRTTVKECHFEILTIALSLNKPIDYILDTFNNTKRDGLVCLYGKQQSVCRSLIIVE